MNMHLLTNIEVTFLFVTVCKLIFFLLCCSQTGHQRWTIQTTPVKIAYWNICYIWILFTEILWIFFSCMCDNLVTVYLHSRPAVALIRKLIAVLESIERLPLHLYDTPGSTYNLQVNLQWYHTVLYIVTQLNILYEFQEKLHTCNLYEIHPYKLDRVN